MANKIKIEKDNVILSIEEEELAQYEARGYNKVGASKKIDSKNFANSKYVEFALEN